MAVTAEVRVTGIKDLNMALNKAVVAVKTGSKEATRNLGLSAMQSARNRAPVGVRPKGASLKNAITYKTSRKGKSYLADVWVKSTNRNNIIALANEFGVPRRTYNLGKENNKKLARWVDIKLKGSFKGNYFTVGGPNTRLGKANKFWEPAFLSFEKRVPHVVAKTLGRRIERALKK